MKRYVRCAVLISVLPVLFGECFIKGIKDAWNGSSVFYRTTSNLKKWINTWKES